MNKLKKKNYNILLNYKHFLQNNFFKKKKFKLKNILFENQILYENQDLNIIELENSQNIKIPVKIFNLKSISTIQSLYDNNLLFNYNLNYNILYNFNKILLSYKKKNKKNIIQGRIVTNKFNKSVIIVLGLTFPMKFINLNTRINFKKRIYIPKHLRKKNKIKKIYKLRNNKINRIIRSYTLRYLNFKIDGNGYKTVFSRVSYLKELIKFTNKKKYKINPLRLKSNFSRKRYVKKQNKYKYK